MPNTDPSTHAAIDAVLDAFHAAAARADAPALFACFAHDGVFLGTDATERWPGQVFRDYVNARFSGGVGWTMTPVRRDVTALRSDVACFDEDLAHARMGPLRGSGVLARGTDGVWRIEQYNLAITIANERFEAFRSIVICG